MKDRFYIQNSVDLLTPSYYQEVIRTETYIVVVSLFKGLTYNFIIPIVEFSKLNVTDIEKDIKKWKAKGYLFSYYIDEYLIESYEGSDLISSIRLYDDLYTYQWIDKKFEIENPYDVVEMDKSNFKEFLTIANVCFPEIKNEEFMTWCLETKDVRTFGVILDFQIVSFGSYLSKRSSEYIFIMNDGTHPEYRRRGIHEFLIKYRVNESIGNKELVCVYANVEKQSSSHLGFVKLGFINGRHYFVYEEGDIL